MKKASPGLPIRHVAVSFDDWDNPSTQDTNLLTPTAVGSSTPTNSALATVVEQSQVSSPQPIIRVTETSFPYTSDETSPRVARSLETEFNEERKAVVPKDEKQPLIETSGDKNELLNDPLGNIPVSNRLVEIPIDFENSNEGSEDLISLKLDQSNKKLENDLSAKLNVLEFNSNREDRVNNSESSDVATIRNNRSAIGGWSDTLGNGNSLSNSVDSGLHESTDHLLDVRDLGSKYTVDTDEPGRDGELRIGQVISVGDSKVGTIRYIGTTDFASGTWVGVELELPIGK